MAEDRASQPLSADLQWTPWHTFALLLIIAIMALIGLLFLTRARLWSWMITLVLLGIFAAVAGRGITGLWHGLLIDNRKGTKRSMQANEEGKSFAFALLAKQMSTEKI